MHDIWAYGRHKTQINIKQHAVQPSKAYRGVKKKNMERKKWKEILGTNNREKRLSRVKKSYNN